MIKNYSYLFLVLSLASCELLNSNSKINYNGEGCISDDFKFPELASNIYGTYTFSYFEDSRININEEDGKLNAVVIGPGDKTVFQFRYRKIDDPMVIDDEFTQLIQFEIDSNISEFNISGVDLKKCNTVVAYLCFCPYGGFHYTEEGCIQGKKLDNLNWEIKIHIRGQIENSVIDEMLNHVFVRDD